MNESRRRHGQLLLSTDRSDYVAGAMGGRRSRDKDSASTWAARLVAVGCLLLLQLSRQTTLFRGRSLFLRHSRRWEAIKTPKRMKERLGRR